MKEIRYVYLVDAIWLSYAAYKNYFTTDFSNIIDVSLGFLCFTVPAVGFFLLFVFHRDSKDEADKND